MSMTETGIKLSPETAVAPGEDGRASLQRRPVIHQAQLPNRSSFQPELRNFKSRGRVILTGIGWVHGEIEEHNETIIARYSDATREDHIRFVFDVSAGAGVVCEPRFWKTEILAPDSVKKFTIHEAIAAILGARDSWPRGEIETQWDVSSNLLTDLINAGQLKSPNGGRLQRPDLEQFLLSRWTGNRA